MRMINMDANISDIEYNGIENIRALIFTDSHLCKFYPFEENFAKLKNKILTLIEREHVNTVFTLGDLINIRTEGSDKKYLEIMEIFRNLPVQVFMIGGNHDRHILCKLQSPLPNVHIIKTLALGIPHPNPPPGTPKRLILSHDFHNHLRLQLNQIADWLYTFRQTLPHLINPDDYILTGHTHNTTMLSDEISASLGPLSEDLHEECYAILTMKNGIHIDFYQSISGEQQAKKNMFINAMKSHQECPCNVMNQ